MDRVLEPSAGGGSFVQSITSRLNDLGSNQVGAQIVACDIDPRALAETSRCTRRYPANLVLGNFLEMDLRELGGRVFDAVVGNPPYVRLHTMDIAAREAARRCLPEGEILDAKASLWAYFPIHAYKFLKSGGRMAWILPETILHSEYGRQLLQWAARNFSRCIAVSLRERCFKIDGAKERVVILLLDRAGQPAVRGIEVAEYDSTSDCIVALSQISQQGSNELPMLNGHAVPHIVSQEAANAAIALNECADLLNLGAISEIRIGVVTGNNEFFVLSEAQRAKAKLRRHHFRAVVSKFIDLGLGFDSDKSNVCRHPEGKECKSLLLCPRPDSVDKDLAAYLATYSMDSIKANRTMAKRAHWQSPVLGQIPDAFLRYMGKAGPRMVLNKNLRYCTNTIHCVFFKPVITKEMQNALCLSLHSTYSQLSAEFEGRQYGSGVLKLEPSEAKRVCLAGNPKAIAALSNRWIELSSRACNDGWETVVNDIDKIIASNSPKLAKALPLDTAASILRCVRKRRSGYIGIDVG